MPLHIYSMDESSLAYPEDCKKSMDRFEMRSLWEFSSRDSGLKSSKSTVGTGTMFIIICEVLRMLYSDVNPHILYLIWEYEFLHNIINFA